MTGQLRILHALGLATALLPLACAERATAGPYSIDILINPYHPGFVDSWLFDINNQGQASGYIITQPGPFARKAILYHDGDAQVLGSGPGTIRAINELGDAVGDFNSSPSSSPPMAQRLPSKSLGTSCPCLLEETFRASTTLAKC